MELPNQDIRPESSAEFASFGIEGIADLGAVVIDEHGVAGYQHQLRVRCERIQSRFELFRQPEIILITQEDDLAGRTRKSRLEGAEDPLIRIVL